MIGLPAHALLLLVTVSTLEGGAGPGVLDCTTAADVARAPAAQTLAAPAWVEPGMTPSVWRLAEAARAARSAEDEDLAKCLLVEAEQDARAALSEEESSTPRRFALAVVLGLRADVEGGRTKVRAASELYEELVVILTEEPGHARARHTLGRLHAGVLRMGGVTRWLATNLLGGAVLKTATWEEAELNLAFAERAAPEVGEHHLQLANLYRDTDRTELALEEVEHVLDLPANSAMARATRSEATSLLKELGS